MKTAIMWVSHAKDLWCFEVSAKSYKRFATGWDYAKCIVPNPDLELFRPACDAAGISLVGFDQHATKGMLHHEIMECYGDLHFPSITDAIFHFDSDQFFCTDVNPGMWLPSDKILIPFRDFAGMLTTPVNSNEMMNFMGFEGRVLDFNRGSYMWKFAADFALGWGVDRSTMCSWPIVHVPGVYAKTRQIIAERHGMSFEDYVFNCRNEFPQTFAEYDTLGAVAHKYFDDHYHWWNIDQLGHPPVRTVGIWSHGGPDKPFHAPAEVGGGFRTPRELYTQFGFW